MDSVVLVLIAVKKKICLTSYPYIFPRKELNFIIFVYRKKRIDCQVHKTKNGKDENEKTSQLSHSSVGASETQRNSSKTEGGKY